MTTRLNNTPITSSILQKFPQQECLRARASSARRASRVVSHLLLDLSTLERLLIVFQKTSKTASKAKASQPSRFRKTRRQPLLLDTQTPERLLAHFSMPSTVSLPCNPLHDKILTDHSRHIQQRSGEPSSPQAYMAAPPRPRRAESPPRGLSLHLAHLGRPHRQGPHPHSSLLRGGPARGWQLVPGATLGWCAPPILPGLVQGVPPQIRPSAILPPSGPPLHALRR